MALTVNAQFGKFLEFAQSQANAASSTAVARIVEDDKGEKAPLAGRNIMVATGDEVHRWERTDAEKSANDKTRAAFKKAVADMFGGENRIPASVRKAMVLGDYNCGKPLTARRIMAVNKALRPYIITDAIDTASSFFAAAGKIVNRDFSNFRPLSPSERQTAWSLVTRFGSGLDEWGLRTLARAAVFAITKGFDPEEKVRRVKSMIAPFRDFKPGDPRFAEIDRQLLPYCQSVLANYMAQGKQFDSEGIFKQFKIDAERIVYTINGNTTYADPEVLNDFKNKIANVQHRKALSCFFTQMSMSTFIMMAQRMALPDPVNEGKVINVMHLPGAEMFVGKKEDEKQVFCVYNPKISLEVSEDQKSAKMTLVNECLLHFANGEEIEDYNMPIGGFSWKQEIVFDLSGEEAVIAETHFGQDLTANIAQRANEA
jgi:hypothetical protein